MEIVLILALAAVIVYHLLSSKKAKRAEQPREEEKPLSPRLMAQLENFWAYDGTPESQKDIEEVERDG